MKEIVCGGIKEVVIERSDYPIEKVRATLEGETITVLGYGTQGRAQSLNLRDNGLPVIVGLRRDGKSWERAEEEGWIPGQSLFSITEATQRGTIVLYLLSDAGQMLRWKEVAPGLQEGNCLYFSHGLSITYSSQTKVIPPDNIDVVLVAPKGSGTSVRGHFLEGRGVNSSFAIERDATGRARERVLALGFGIGSGYLFETSFQKEVYSDLVGERGVLMGGIHGLMLAQYEVLRSRGHSPSEAFNETVEEATQSIYPLIGKNGMDWMYAQCSSTARRGALDWHLRFAEAVRPLFEELYESVVQGEETQRVIDTNSQFDYLEKLDLELNTMKESEMWEIGRMTREFRPERHAPKW